MFDIINYGAINQAFLSRASSPRIKAIKVSFFEKNPESVGLEKIPLGEHYSASRRSTVEKAILWFPHDFKQMQRAARTQKEENYTHPIKNVFLSLCQNYYLKCFFWSKNAKKLSFSTLFHFFFFLTSVFCNAHFRVNSVTKLLFDE